MDEDRVKGSARQAGGKLKEGAGRITGDEKLRSEGLLDQFKGKLQNAFGSIKDAFRRR